MAVQKGTVGAVFGVKMTSILVNGGTHEIIRTYNYSKEADTKEIRGNTGDVVNVTFYNARERMTVDIIITDASGSGEMGKALDDFILLPGVGDEAIVTCPISTPPTGDTQVDSTTGAVPNHAWIVESASKVATQDDHATMSLTLVRWAVDLNTISS